MKCSCEEKDRNWSIVHTRKISNGKNCGSQWTTTSEKTIKEVKT